MYRTVNLTRPYRKAYRAQGVPFSRQFLLVSPITRFRLAPQDVCVYRYATPPLIYVRRYGLKGPRDY